MHGKSNLLIGMVCSTYLKTNGGLEVLSALHYGALSVSAVGPKTFIQNAHFIKNQEPNGLLCHHCRLVCLMGEQELADLGIPFWTALEDLVPPQ